jgi:hypothetical protein
MGRTQPKTYVSHSEIEAFQLCLVKWFLIYVVGLGVLRKTSAQSMGSMWHTLIQDWWSINAKPCGMGDPDAGMDLVGHLLSDWIDQRLEFDDEEEVKAQASVLWSLRHHYGRTYRLQRLYLEGSPETKGHGGLPVGPKGHASPAVGYKGYRDTDARDEHGRLWVVESKSTSKALDQWLSQHAHSRQPFGYSWLAAMEHGEAPVGIIYDLALRTKKPIPRATDWPLVAKDTRLSKTAPANVSAETFLKALEIHGFSIEDQPYYGETLAKLKNKPDPFLMRKKILISRNEVDYILSELHTMALAIRRARAQMTDRSFASTQMDFEDQSHRQAVGRYIADNIGRCPRNPSACWSFQSQCPFALICANPKEVDHVLLGYRPPRPVRKEG